jgi:hypothetical protein
MGKLKIIYNDFGIANRIGDVILVNRRLKKEPELCQWVIEHEIKHTGKGMTKEDIEHDMFINKFWNKQLAKFMWRNPQTFAQFFPVMKYKGELYWDATLLWIYGLALIGFIVSF